VGSSYDLDVSIIVNEINGKEILRLEKVHLQKGNNFYPIIAMKNAAAGIYSVSINGNNVNLTSKFTNVLK